jgi:hypothetical protein
MSLHGEESPQVEGELFRHLALAVHLHAAISLKGRTGQDANR